MPRKLTDDEFWNLIGLFDWEQSGDDLPDQPVIQPAVDALSSLSIEEIFGFEDILTEKLYALDTEAHAREIGEDAYVNEDKHFSVDLFLYVRCCVVANGPELYSSVLANPKEFPEDIDFESLLAVAPNAFEKKTGQNYDYSSSLSYETFSNRKGWGADSEKEA